MLIVLHSSWQMQASHGGFLLEMHPDRIECNLVQQQPVECDLVLGGFHEGIPDAGVQ